MLRVLTVTVTYAAFAIMIAQSQPTPLTLGQDIDWPPYAFKDSNGVLQGFGKDIADGLNALCPDELAITVVEVPWSECWSSAGGGSLGGMIDSGEIDGCMTYTHTRGVRTQYCDFSHAILQVNKAAGLMTLLNADGTPAVDGRDNLQGKTVVDVGGWAPTADTISIVDNKCTNQPYSSGHTLVVGEGNDEAMYMLRNGSADAMFIYADQAENYDCTSAANQGVQIAWDCTNWAGFGTEYAYVQTGQFGYTHNGTTLILGKKDSGKAELVNSCLARYMETEAYYNVCVTHGFVNDCYPNSFFPSSASNVPPPKTRTDELTTTCAQGYCPCPPAPTSAPTEAPEASSAQGRFSMNAVALVLTTAAISAL